MQASNARKTFDLFLRNNKPGTVLIYHMGDLQLDRYRGPSCLAVHATAHAAWDLMQEGKITLYQYKVERGIYRYIARILPPPHKPVQWVGCYNTPYRTMKGKPHGNPNASTTQPVSSIRPQRGTDCGVAVERRAEQGQGRALPDAA